MDKFHTQGVENNGNGLTCLWTDWVVARATQPGVVIAVLLVPLAFVVATRYTSERSSHLVSGGKAWTVWRVPYWFPVIGHGVSL